MNVPSICSACSAENDHFADECFKCGRGLFALTEGTLLALRYKILSRLGRGGMGMVYEAYDEMLKRRVAVKVLRPDRERSGEMENRFRSECKLARQVRHKNVCRIYEYGQDQGRHFVSMELIEGSDFKAILRDRGAFSWEEAFEVAVQLAEGLQAMHEAGIVHRDLKPSNIMRDPEGVVRLMDLGIAKRFEAGDGATSHTGTGRVVGTPEYMSPEQIYGERVDPRSDVYSLGIVVFELFTGGTPFRGDTPASTMMKQIREPPPLAAAMAARLPRHLVPVLRTALEKRPDERFGSAIQMRDAVLQARALTIPLEDAEKDHQTEHHRAGIDWRPLPPPKFADDSSEMLRAPKPSRELGPVAADETEHHAESQRLRPRVPDFSDDSSARWPSPRPMAPSAPLPRDGVHRRWLGTVALFGIGVLGIAGAGLLPSRTTPGVGDGQHTESLTPRSSPPVDLAGRVAETPAPAPMARVEQQPSVRSAVPDRPQAQTLGSPTLVQGPTELPKPEPSPTADTALENASPVPAPQTKPPDPVAPIESGMLSLVALPWAEVAVDGIPVGITPLKPISLAPGLHIVLLINPGYQPLIKKVTVEPGKTTNLEVDLTREAFPKKRS